METVVAKQLRRRFEPRAEASPPSRWRTAGLAFSVFLTVAALCTAVTYSSRELAATPEGTAGEQEPVYLPDVRFLRLASLGYENAIADVLWFRAINYFGKHFRGDRLYPWLARMCDLVTDLDPRSRHVYLFAGFLLPWEAQLPDDGIRLLEKGAKQFPDDWQMHYFLGFSLYYFKDQREAALPHLRRAAELPGTHPFVTRLAAMLYAEQYGTGTTREFLEGLKQGAGSSGMAGIIDERLRDLDLSEHIAMLEDGVQRFRAQTGHAPATLNDLVVAGIVRAIPSEPFGQAYVLDPATGNVNSTSGRKPLKAYESERRRQLLSGQAPRD